MEVTHECQQNDTIGTVGENLVYFEQGKWWLSTDCGCCHLSINFCPYCGTNLYKEGYHGKG